MPLSFFRAFRRQDSHGKRTLLHRDLPPTKKPLVSHQMQPNAAGSATPSFAVRHNQVVKNCFHHTQTRPAMVRWCIGERMKEIMRRKGICIRFRLPQRVNRITRRHRKFSDCACHLLQNIFRRFTIRLSLRFAILLIERSFDVFSVYLTVMRTVLFDFRGDVLFNPVKDFGCGFFHASFTSFASVSAGLWQKSGLSLY